MVVKLKHESEALLPSYFSLVMATGIVSIASYFYNFIYFAELLVYLNAIAYAILWGFTLARIIFYPSKYLQDLRDHKRGPGFFTVVAGNNTLGAQLVIIWHAVTAGYVLWLFGLALWFIYQYVIFTSLMITRDKPTIDKGISGTWLVAIVSTQSVAVLGVRVSSLHPESYLVALIMYFIGWAMYLIIIGMISYRLLFFRLEPADATGPYWINMGATAITTLAGSLLILYVGNSSVPITNMMPFIEGSTMLIWAYGSWWIPWLLIIGFWRHTVGGVKLLSYDPQFWGAVFPMGMYTVCTYMMIKATDFTILSIIPSIFIYVAIIAWLYQSAGLVYNIVRKITKSYLPAGM